MPSIEKLRKKIKKYEEQLRRKRSKRPSSSSRSPSPPSRRRRRRHSPSPARSDWSRPPATSSPRTPPRDLSPPCEDTMVISDAEVAPVVLPVTDTITDQPSVKEATATDPEPATNPFMEALGDEYGETVEYEGTINEDIAKRWTHILANGLKREERDDITKKYKIPSNCTTLDAPALNMEVMNVLTEASKLRDKGIELGQRQIALATAIIGQVMTHIMEDEIHNKVSSITMLSEATKLLIDTNHHQNMLRKKLITPSLDKNFNQWLDAKKRDKYLFGEDLTEKVKTSKQLQQLTAQIKKTTKPTIQPHHNAPGKARGPAQFKNSRTAARAGPKSRYQPAAQQPQPQRTSTAPQPPYYKRAPTQQRYRQRPERTFHAPSRR